jgi:prepilin-type N-terminal cleavage/methylation domain-containing protein
MLFLGFAGQDIANDPTAITEELSVRRTRRGFTLIEILVVIGIIAALIAMLFLGFKYVGKSSRDNMSHTMLQNMRSMLTEYTTSGGTIDKLEDIYSPNYSVTAPTGSMEEGQTLRDNSIAVNQTRTVMARLLAVPSNKKVLDSLPPDQVWRTGNGVVLLDGFHNPILYVPRRGLTGVNLGKTGEQSFSNTNQTVVSPGARNLGSNVREGQPFFASAGEDGDFSKGDDNHYSYEQ